MTVLQLSKLLNDRLKAKGMTLYQLHTSLAGKVSHQTVYNAFAGKPIKTDTLLLILKALDMEIK